MFLTPSQLPEGKKSVWKECQAYTVQMIELSMPTNTNTSQHHYSCRVTWYQVTSIHYLYQVTIEPWLTGYSQTDHNEQLKRNFMSFSSHKLTICSHGIVNSQTETAIWDRCKYCSRLEVRNDIFSEENSKYLSLHVGAGLGHEPTHYELKVPTSGVFCQRLESRLFRTQNEGPTFEHWIPYIKARVHFIN